MMLVINYPDCQVGNDPAIAPIKNDELILRRLPVQLLINTTCPGNGYLHDFHFSSPAFSSDHRSVIRSEAHKYSVVFADLLPGELSNIDYSRSSHIRIPCHPVLRRFAIGTSLSVVAAR